MYDVVVFIFLELKERLDGPLAVKIEDSDLDDTTGKLCVDRTERFLQRIGFGEVCGERGGCSTRLGDFGFKSRKVASSTCEECDCKPFGRKCSSDRGAGTCRGNVVNLGYK